MAGKREAADAVIIASIGLLVVVFGIFGFLIYQGYQQTLHQAERKAEVGADVLSHQAAAFLGARFDLLSDFADEFANLSGPALGTAATARLAKAPPSLVVAVYDDAGQLLAKTGAGFPATIADADYFQQLIAGGARAVSTQTRINAKSVEPTFVIAVGLRAGERLTGVVALQVDNTLLDGLPAALDLGPESTISLLREDGWIVARVPTLETPLNLANLPVWGTLSGAPSGTYFSPGSPADGIARVVAFRKVPGLPLIALSAISRDTLLAQLWSAVWTVLFLMGPIAIALLVGSLWTARLLRRSEADRKSLALLVARNETLFREIHHRVKNNLQVVSALIQLQPIDRAIKLEMGRRIAAMSAVHEQIYRSNDFESVQLKQYLHNLIEGIHAGQGPQVHLVEDLDDLLVDKDIATPLGLLVNEVVSNAFKHGFAEGRPGTLWVTLGQADADQARLVIRDDGIGFDPEAPSNGIGRKLIAAFTQQIGGKAQFSSANGAVFDVVFPLKHVDDHQT